MSIMVKDVMDKDVPTVKPDAKVKDFVKTLVKHNLRFMPVVNDAGVVVGGISETDLMKLIKIQPLPTVSAVWTSLSKETINKTVLEIMNPRPIIINERAEMIDALNLMSASNVNVLIVLDMNNKLAGLVRFRKIIEKMMENLDRT
jgi:predicted transcriptional regulator